MPNKNQSDDHDMILLFKYLITSRKIKNSKKRMNDLNIELENLQDELNQLRSALTNIPIGEQNITLDELYNITIK